MKILQAVTSLNPASGGVASSACLLHRDLADMGHELETICVDDPHAEWLYSCPQYCRAFGPGRSSYQYSPLLSDWLRQHVARFDAVIVHGLWQHIGLAVRSACRTASVPYFVFCHGMLDPWFKRTFPLKHLKKWLYWPWGEYRVLRDAAAVFFTCEEERRLARASFWHYSCNEQVVGLGIEDPPGDSAGQLRAFAGQFPELNTKRFLLFLGRLHPKKGLEMLIAAFGKVAPLETDLHLVIAGAPSGVGIGSGYLEQLKSLALAQCPQDRVHFVGMLQGPAKWGALRSAEAFVLPSHQENFGIAVVEALACGTFVLISRQVNIWREVEASGAGLISDDTAEGTLALLQAWLHNHISRQCEELGRARKCFRELFEIRQVSDKVVASIIQVDKISQ
jgi:glycosyltransferase involved in cell wall biosynthesis